MRFPDKRFKHGACFYNRKLYNIWNMIMQRCYNVNRSNYINYGGRGISVCEEWHNPMDFIYWAEGNGYQQGLQIDRINNNDNYCPENCQWVTPEVNSLNKRTSKHLVIGKQRKSVVEWAKLTGISRYTVYWWIKEKGEIYAQERLGASLNNPIINSAKG